MIQRQECCAASADREQYSAAMSHLLILRPINRTLQRREAAVVPRVQVVRIILRQRVVERQCSVQRERGGRY